MKKKFLAFVLVAVLSAITAFTFTACGDGDKGSGDNRPADTFYQGTLSSESYSTGNAAAEAFIETEIKGDVTNAVFVDYKKSADLTETEISMLSIPETEKTEIESMEKGTVTYAVVKGGALTSADSVDPDVKLYVIIIVKYKNNTYKYYAPVINNGDPLTKAYYDEVFASEKYINCTQTSDMTCNVSASVQGMSFTVKLNMKIVMQITDKYIYAVTTTAMSIPYTGDIKSTVKVLTVTDPDSDYFGYTYQNTQANGTGFGWTVAVRPGDDSEDTDDTELTGEIKPEFDYSYFIKTKSGFKVNSEKLSAFIKETLKNLPDEVGGGMEFTNVKASAEYFVKDGLISDSVLNLTGQYTMDIEGQKLTYKLKQKMTTVYGEFGTTVITLPSDLDMESLA